MLLPAGLPLGELPASWAVTSDSIAAWVAGRIGAGRLVLVKHDEALTSRGELRPGAVDDYLPTVLADARFETWVVGGRDPDHLAELLDHGTTVGARIAAARLLPWRNG